MNMFAGLFRLRSLCIQANRSACADHCVANRGLPKRHRSRASSLSVAGGWISHHHGELPFLRRPSAWKNVFRENMTLTLARSAFVLRGLRVAVSLRAVFASSARSPPPTGPLQGDLFASHSRLICRVPPNPCFSNPS